MLQKLTLSPLGPEDPCAPWMRRTIIDCATDSLGIPNQSQSSHIKSPNISFVSAFFCGQTCRRDASSELVSGPAAIYVNKLRDEKRSKPQEFREITAERLRKNDWRL